MYQGVCPPEILEGSQPARELMKQQLNKGSIQLLEYVQLISRVSADDNKEAYMKLWYPDVEPRMLYLAIKDKTKLVKYILHAKHKKIDSKPDKSDWLLAEELPDWV